MVGLGEERHEVDDTVRAIRASGTDVLTVGQYLRPSNDHLPLQRYYTPAEFAEIKAFALSLGYGHVESGPLVRSSYHADEHVPPPAASAS
jgi:lipoic acid synthetase